MSALIPTQERPAPVLILGLAEPFSGPGEDDLRRLFEILFVVINEDLLPLDIMPRKNRGVCVEQRVAQVGQFIRQTHPRPSLRNRDFAPVPLVKPGALLGELQQRILRSGLLKYLLRNSREHFTLHWLVVEVFE